MIWGATYTNHDGVEINLNDGNVCRFAPEGLPRGIFNPRFESLDIEVPSNLPAAAFQTILMLPRTIEMELWYVGRPVEILSYAGYIVNSFWADLRDAERGVFRHTVENLVDRSIKCSVANLGDLANLLSRFQNVPTRAVMPLAFFCQDPTFYGATVTPTPSAFNDGTPVLISCANAGSAYSYPRITYTGIVEDPQVTDLDGRIWTLEKHTTHANDVIVMNLDPLELSVLYTPNGGAETSIANLRSSSSRLVRVAPGTENLTFVSADGTPSGNATIGVEFESRYPAHGIA